MMRLILSSTDDSRCSTLDTSILDAQEVALLLLLEETTAGTESLSVEATAVDGTVSDKLLLMGEAAAVTTAGAVTAASVVLLTAVASTLTDRRLDVVAVGELDGTTVGELVGITVLTSAATVAGGWTIVATCTPLTPIVTAVTVEKATHDERLYAIVWTAYEASLTAYPHRPSPGVDSDQYQWSRPSAPHLAGLQSQRGFVIGPDRIDTDILVRHGLQ